jgi:glycosyltransferase involved in cell wall biosynthesis
VTALHQVLPTFAGRDAIGMHCLRVQHLLREAGYDSEIYTLDAHDDVQDACRAADELVASSGTWILYHFSIGSPLLDHIRTLDARLALDYHNVTDPKYFRRWEPAAADRMAEGRAQLVQVVADTRFALAKSHFSEGELRAVGFNPTAVAPVLIDFSVYDNEPDPAVLATRAARREAGGADWISVGRLAPNKCAHDVIAAFAVYRTCYDHDARLTLVGDRHAAMQYTSACEELAADLGVADAVTFTGSVSHSELLAVYRTADVFVSCSEHEGFGVPVLEAMHFDVPVVAHAAAATPEIVADAGLLFDEKDPLLLATAVDEILGSTDLRHALTTAGRKRVEAFDLPVTGPRFIETLQAMVERGDEPGS